MLLSLVLSKSLSSIVVRHGWRFAKFQFKKWNYFNKVWWRGRQQAQRYKKNIHLIDENYFTEQNNVTVFLDQLNKSKNKKKEADVHIETKIGSRSKDDQIAPDKSVTSENIQERDGVAASV